MCVIKGYGHSLVALLWWTLAPDIMPGVGLARKGLAAAGTAFPFNYPPPSLTPQTLAKNNQPKTWSESGEFTTIKVLDGGLDVWMTIGTPSAEHYFC